MVPDAAVLFVRGVVIAPRRHGGPFSPGSADGTVSGSSEFHVKVSFCELGRQESLDAGRGAFGRGRLPTAVRWMRL